MAVVKAPIPRKVRVGNKQYSIEIVEAMLEKRVMGRISYTAQTIKLGRRSNVTQKVFPPEQVQESFWHEVTHAILHDMNTSLTYNEKFVTAFAKRLNQAVNTAVL